MRQRLAVAAFCALGIATSTAFAQTPDFLRDQAMTEAIVRGQPFSADGTVSLKLVLYDGTRIERTVPAKYYRDSEGRVRREQTIMGLSPINPRRDTEAVVTIVDPVAGFIYTMVGNKQEAQRMQIPVPAGVDLKQFVDRLKMIEFVAAERREVIRTQPQIARTAVSLGTREVNGVQAVGRRVTTTIPPGAMGNDRQIQVIDENWTANDLRLQVLTRHSDPRTGDVETAYTNITRTEPSPDLFKIPAGYKIVDVPSTVKVGIK